MLENVNARMKGFRSKQLMLYQSYRVDPGSGIVDAVADGFTLKNGLVFSEVENVV